MNWRITNRHDITFVDAERNDKPTWTYHGEMNKDLQPHGLGAQYIEGKFYRGGYWVNGKLYDSDRLSKEEYDRQMNERLNNL